MSVFMSFGALCHVLVRRELGHLIRIFLPLSISGVFFVYSKGGGSGSLSSCLIIVACEENESYFALFFLSFFQVLSMEVCKA